MKRRLLPYRKSLAGTLLAAREAVMMPVRVVLRDVEVTEQQWRVLRVLADEGVVEATALASSAMLLAPSLTRILRELEARRLITRTTAKDDGRKSLMAISPRGRSLIEHTAARTLDILDGYAQRFGKARMDALVDELRAFTKAIEQPVDESGVVEDRGSDHPHD